MVPTAPARPTTGVWLFSDAPAAELVEAIVIADDAGIDEVWVADEGVSREPVAVLAAAALRTRRVRLGVGITSPLLRHPGAIGSSLATLDELSGGRALLGLGLGGSLSLEPFGIDVERPVALIRNAIRIARAVITGVSCEGYERPAHAAPARSVPIHVGARGEQLNRLASREADGVFLSGLPLSGLTERVAWARSARPITVGLYASARFVDSTRSGGRPTSGSVPADETALSGTPHAVAEGLRDLIETHAPETIGLALVDGRPPVSMMRQAAETLHHLREP